MSDKKYGLVLAGGGAKGAYEIGALQALEELGVLKDINMVSGNSIGSVNITLFAEGDMKKARSIWENINPDDFIELDNNGFDISKPGDGIFSREGLCKIIKTNVDLAKIKNADIPYYICVCTRLEDGMAVPRYIKLNGMDEDKILNFIMASSAIPIVYDNVVIDGIAYFDGGLCDNTPVVPLYEEGATDIIVISNDDAYVPDHYRYPSAKLYPIIPSHDLNIEASFGTLDFNKHNVKYRLTLGYLDAKAVMSAYLEDRPVPNLSNNHTLAMQELNKARLDSKVNDNMAGLARILGTNDFL